MSYRGVMAESGDVQTVCFFFDASGVLISGLDLLYSEDTEFSLYILSDL